MTAPVFRAPEPVDPLQDWIDRYGLTEVKPSHACLIWLNRGRHSANHCAWARWSDHPSAWRTPAGGRLLLVQPYNFEQHYLEMAKALNCYPQVFLRFERGGWHDPKTALVEIWENGRAYNEARK